MTIEQLRSSIDMGSNSVLLLIGKVAGEHLEVLVDESRVTSLGKDLDVSKRFIQESMDKTYQALSDYKKIIEENGLLTSNTIITATEASRVAENAKEFFTKIHKDLGFNIQLISSEGEAYYTGRGISLSTEANRTQAEKLIVDLGGASTELIKINTDPFKIKTSISLPFGSVRGQDWIEKDIFLEKVTQILSEHDLTSYQSQSAIFVAGTMTSLACIMKKLSQFDSSEINGQVFSTEMFNQTVCEIAEMSHEKLLSTFPYLGKRAKTVSAGGLIIKSLNASMGIQSLEISTLGLRHGTLFEGGIDGRFTT